MFEAELRELDSKTITAALDAGWQPTEDELWKGFKECLADSSHHYETLVAKIQEAVDGASKVELMQNYIESSADVWLEEHENRGEAIV